MKEILIKEIYPKDFEHLLHLMRKERVGDHTHNTFYIGAFIDNKLVGMVGWMLIGRVLRYKSDYVLKEHRGKGIYYQLFKAREERCKSRSLVYTAFCTEYSLPTYLKFGFKPKHNRNGITFVERKQYE